MTAAAPFDLRAARLNAGLTQRALAEACGVSLTTIQRLEDGRAATPRNAKKVADFLSTDARPVVVTDLLPVEAPATNVREAA